MKQSVEVLNKIGPTTWKCWESAIRKDCTGNMLLDWEITGPMHNCLDCGAVKEYKGCYLIVDTLSKALKKISKYCSDAKTEHDLQIKNRKKWLLDYIEEQDAIELKEQLKKLAVNTDWSGDHKVWEHLENLLGDKLE